MHVFSIKKMLKNGCQAVLYPACDKCSGSSVTEQMRVYTLFAIKLHTTILCPKAVNDTQISTGGAGGAGTWPKKMTRPPTDRNRFSQFFSVHPKI